MDIGGIYSTQVGVPEVESAALRSRLMPWGTTRENRHDRLDVYGVAAALHPGLAAAPGATAAARARVLFLCTGNSARSQMAQALIEKLSGGAVRAASAGSRPKPLRPEAVRVMRARGMDIAGRRSKHLSEFADERFDAVVTLCDRVREVCPEFPGGPEAIHWSIPDPAREGGPAFEHVAEELAVRIRFLLATMNPTLEAVTHA
jgi:protein-tyrosine-phosphatase